LYLEAATQTPTRRAAEISIQIPRTARTINHTIVPTASLQQVYYKEESPIKLDLQYYFIVLFQTEV
jgi:hypothetical protein